jgi:hypothetical protein
MRLNIKSKYRKIYGGLHLPKDLWELTNKEEGEGEGYEIYTYTNKQDRNLTAVFSYYGNGNKKYEEWYINYERHREDGPAKIWYNPDGSIKGRQWWREGKAISV